MRGSPNRWLAGRRWCERTLRRGTAFEHPRGVIQPGSSVPSPCASRTSAPSPVRSGSATASKTLPESGTTPLRVRWLNSSPESSRMIENSPQSRCKRPVTTELGSRFGARNQVVISKPDASLTPRRFRRSGFPRPTILHHRLLSLRPAGLRERDRRRYLQRPLGQDSLHHLRWRRADPHGK